MCCTILYVLLLLLLLLLVMEVAEGAGYYLWGVGIDENLDRCSSSILAV